MNWTNLWLKLFGTDTFCGLNMGFWISMAVVMLIVVIMNVVFWSVKPTQNGNGSTLHQNLRSNRP